MDQKSAVGIRDAQIINEDRSLSTPKFVTPLLHAVSPFKIYTFYKFKTQNCSLIY